MLKFRSMQAPLGIALLTCDATAADPSGKTTLYGVFDRILTERFPAVHPLFSVFWRCVVPGPGRVSVTILRPNGDALLDLEPAETSHDSPHALQGTYTLGGVEFPDEGDYVLVLKYNGKDIQQAPLWVRRRSDA